MIIKLCSLFLIFLSCAYGEVRIKDINYVDDGSGERKFVVSFKGNMSQKPVVSIRDRILQVAFTDAVAWPKIEKEQELENGKTTKMMAYQYNKDVVRARLLMNRRIRVLPSDLVVDIKKNEIRVTIPKKSFSNTRVVKKQLDEEYLNKLLTIEKKKVEKKKDKVSILQSAQNKSSKKGFSVSTYVWKFIGFLLLVVGIFYVLVSLFKKGVLKKGRLGFLNNNEIVSVISTTYIAPKKALLLVQAHNQIFLLSDTDKGISLLSELNDLPGLLKEGEKKVAGNNFDTELNDSKVEEKTNNIKLKEDINISSNATTKFSEQIKNKMKGFKSLQQNNSRADN